MRNVRALVDHFGVRDVGREWTKRVSNPCCSSGARGWRSWGRWPPEWLEISRTIAIVVFDGDELRLLL
jgi:hypothetical protein